MNKTVWLLTMLAVSSALYAQETCQLGKDELLAAFEQYNSAALKEATVNELYADILNKLAAAYCAPRTEQNQYELIALAKNFDNSLRLHALRTHYFETRTLQAMSGVEGLEGLEQSTRGALKEVVQSIFDNTLEVKNIQLKDYKKQLKQTRKNAALSTEQKQQRVTQLSAQIKQIKREVRWLKQNSKQKIQDTANAYFAEILTDYMAAQPQQLRAQQSLSWDIKANHKKPVAQ